MEIPDFNLPERHPLIRIKRRVGRARRWVRRKWWERNIGREYHEWIAESHATPPGSIDNTIAIAVVIPVFNPPLGMLVECVQSVLHQSARNWQLIVSDDGSTEPAVCAYLDELAETASADPRVMVLRSVNGGISQACNNGVARVHAPYFGWLDHDDRLNPRAIELFSLALAEQEETGPPADVIYSDEDKIDVHGRHFELYCKPDYSPELLMTQMYLCHFTAFRTDRVRAVGGFRTAMDGAQDFDLALRVLAPGAPEESPVVLHVPRPLYHWRAWAQSTALSIEAKPWAQQAAARAQQDHLDRVFGGGTVGPSRVPGLNTVHPRVMSKETGPQVSVIIPTIGTIDDSAGVRHVERAVRSLHERQDMTGMEILAVTTGDIAAIPGVDQQIPHYPSEFNFAEAINIGRAHARGTYVLLLNDDTAAVADEPITRLLELGQIPDVGIVGAKLTYPDGRLQHVGMILLPSGPTHPFISKPGRDFGYFGSTLTPRNFSAVTAAAMLVRSEVFDAAGGFDPAFARDFNDVDFSLRVRRLGCRVAWTPYAHFTHFEGASLARRKPDPIEHAEFIRRWDDVLQADPFYSPRLNAQLARIYEAR